MKTRRFITIGSATIAALLVQSAPAAFAMGAGNNSLNRASATQLTMVAPAPVSGATPKGCHSITTAGAYRVSATQNTRACVVVAGSVIWLDSDGASSKSARTRVAMRGNGG
jgi:hypothetical protein